MFEIGANSPPALNFLIVPVTVSALSCLEKTLLLTHILPL